MYATRFKSYILVSFLIGASACTLANAQGMDVRYQLVTNDFALEYGTDVATDGQYVAVGSPFSQAAHGAVFVYNAETGVELDMILGPTSSTRFGRAVSMYNGYLAIGAESVPGLIGVAQVHDVVAGELVSEFVGDDTTVNDLFGRSIAIDGDYVVVGARHDSTHALRAGSAYLFDRDTGQQLHKFEPSGSGEEDNYGWSVAIQGDLVAVGSRAGGEVYLYNASTGGFVDILRPSDPDIDFGNAISMDAEYIVVSEADLGFDSQVFVYDRSSLELLYSLDGTSEFGNDVAVDDGLLVLGKFRSSGGIVHVYAAGTGQLITQISTADTESFGKTVAIRNRTIAVGDYLADQAFVIDFQPCNPADLAMPFYQLTFFDVSAYIAAFTLQNPEADLNHDGAFNFFDISIFLSEFQSGCF